MYLISNSPSGGLETPTGITVCDPGTGVVSASSSKVVSLELMEGDRVDVNFIVVEEVVVVVVDLIVVEEVVDKVVVEVVEEDDLIVVVEVGGVVLGVVDEDVS